MIPVWVELVCDGCSKADQGRFTCGPIPRASMKVEAANLGWIFPKHGPTLCGRKCAEVEGYDYDAHRKEKAP